MLKQRGIVLQKKHSFTKKQKQIQTTTEKIMSTCIIVYTTEKL